VLVKFHVAVRKLGVRVDQEDGFIEHDLPLDLLLYSLITIDSQIELLRSVVAVGQ